MLGSQKYVLDKSTTKDAPIGITKKTTSDDLDSNSNNGVGIAVTSSWSSSNCDAPAIDFGAISLGQCVRNFLPAMDSCESDFFATSFTPLTPGALLPLSSKEKKGQQAVELFH